MKQELDDALVKDFPNLWKDRNKSMMESSLCWGFPEDGWEPLIRKTSEKLEAIIISLPEDQRHQYRAAQCKEKFAVLTIYLMTRPTNEMKQVIDDAANDSATICEFCGKPGEIRNTSWRLTLCDGCYANKLDRV